MVGAGTANPDTSRAKAAPATPTPSWSVHEKTPGVLKVNGLVWSRGNPELI